MNDNPKLVLLEQHPAKIRNDTDAEELASLIDIMKDINRRCRATGYDGNALLPLFIQLAKCCQAGDFDRTR